MSLATPRSFYAAIGAPTTNDERAVFGRVPKRLSGALIYLKQPASNRAFLGSSSLMFLSPLLGGPKNMRDFRSKVASALLALAAWTATVNPLQADTGTVRVLFSSAGVVVGLGNGRGTLTFHGKTYPFEVSGQSFGATLALTVGELEGRALNLHSPGDLAGNYVAIGVGGALVGGVGVARLRNAKGVILVVRGPRLGAGLSVSLARVTITMM